MLRSVLFRRVVLRSVLADVSEILSLAAFLTMIACVAKAAGGI